jgi:iron complex transport system ATP-binding protein
MLSAENIEVSLSGTPVLRGVSLTAEPGQVTVVAGPNGSGKTTLLRAMTQDLPYRGNIRLDGWRHAGPSCRRRAASPFPSPCSKSSGSA